MIETFPNSFELELPSGELLAYIEAGARLNFPPPTTKINEFDAERLRSYHLPPKPDRNTAPRAYQNWLRAVSEPLSFPKTRDPRELFRVLPLSLLADPGVRTVSSSNWSGGFVTPRDRRSIGLVQAQWTVPTIRAEDPDRLHAFSAWVGLDGYVSSTQSMPQTGVWHGQIPLSNMPIQLAWWQWWLKPDKTSRFVFIPGVAVRAADPVYAQVQEIDRSTCNFFIKNMRSGAAFSMDFTLPNPFREGTRSYDLSVEGRTAEWIVERPMVPGVQPQLADFNELTFVDCAAGVHDRGSSSGPIHDLPLDRMRLIRLNDWEDRDTPGRLASRPSHRQDDQVFLEYIHR